MRFKMTSKNPFRNFVRNLRRITISNLNDKDKDILYRQLYNEMKKNLKESEIYLNSSPAFAERCKHWNQINILDSITPVRNLKNPFLCLKREIEYALSTSVNTYLVRNVSKSLMWFYAAPYSDDWVT